VAHAPPPSTGITEGDVREAQRAARERGHLARSGRDGRLSRQGRGGWDPSDDALGARDGNQRGRGR
jgi:hypothetical protein